MTNILNTLIKNNLTISFVESMTGGLLSYELVRLYNASKVYKEGFVLYSNEAKSKYLNIDLNYIENNGVVSREVAGLMAQNLKEITGADITVSITGYSSGHEPNKAFIGVMIHNLLYVEDIEFYPEDKREQNIKLTVKKAIKMLKEILKNHVAI
ncbi:CinA family protein [Acholeplasma granularum]|uniref:CinA family protein n=1 Tax=Acholeplasma granularum TaxID=264635 RepID=UPI000471023A|nr:CinA family protein [Acholeplasma granularum]